MGTTARVDTDTRSDVRSQATPAGTCRKTKTSRGVVCSPVTQRPDWGARYGFRVVLTSRPSMVQIDVQIMVQSRVTSRPDSDCLGETCLERHSVIACCNRPSCRGIHLHAVVFMGRLFLHWFPINTSSLFLSSHTVVFNIVTITRPGRPSAGAGNITSSAYMEFFARLSVTRHIKTEVVWQPWHLGSARSGCLLYG